MKNINLHKAKQNKNDEFYTRYEDIETELKHYPVEYFKDKVIYCPCDVGIDDLSVPKSNFIKYFEHNKERFGYKKLIHTSLQEGYDYRSEYCQKLFKEADVVVTNPPFSLFRDFVPYLIKHNVNYLVLGGQNAVTYKELFNYIKENKLWLGNVPMGVPLLFIVDEEYQQVLKEEKKEGTGYKIVNGTVYARVPSIWFTNMDYKKRHEELLLIKKYDANAYPKYDNYDAIEVSKITDLPVNYDGVMGVPITYLDKHNPDQFEILGYTGGLGWNEQNDVQTTKEYVDAKQHNPDGSITSGGKVNTGAALRYDSIPADRYYSASNVNGYLLRTYGRILIRRKKDA